MNITELTEKHNGVVQYLRELEQQHANEKAAMQDDIDSLLSRVAALESRLSDIE